MGQCRWSASAYNLDLCCRCSLIIRDTTFGVNPGVPDARGKEPPVRAEHERDTRSRRRVHEADLVESATNSSRREQRRFPVRGSRI